MMKRKFGRLASDMDPPLPAATSRRSPPRPQPPDQPLEQGPRNVGRSAGRAARPVFRGGGARQGIRMELVVDVKLHSYGDLVVLQDIDLHLRPGEIVSVIGPSCY